MIDSGIVYVGHRRLRVARALLDTKTHFRIEKIAKPSVLYKQDSLLILDKPCLMTSEELLRFYPDYQLLNRLDKETSGVILLGLKDDEELQKKTIHAFKKQEVYKEYLAIVNGLINDEMQIDKPILTQKNSKAKSTIHQKGKPALTHITPLEYENKKTLLKVVIKTGRTHQIRAHLASIGYPILGDMQYGGKEAKRIFLHSHKINLFNIQITAQKPSDFKL
ncbi:hypothetical protein CCZ01_08170 [Helicobacter monodelphidis]|nr:hypothetical protein CCZ01_08170 [Helicobacter sp. 15-1451]